MDQPLYVTKWGTMKRMLKTGQKNILWSEVWSVKLIHPSCEVWNSKATRLQLHLHQSQQCYCVASTVSWAVARTREKLCNSFREHVALKWHITLKTEASEAECEQLLQPTMMDTLVHQRDQEKQWFSQCPHFLQHPPKIWGTRLIFC